MLPAYGLDPEPRRWSHLPLDTNFIGAAYIYTEADILVDPTLLIEDTQLEMNTLGIKYIHSFELLGKSARVDVTQSFQEGKWTGKLNGASTSTTRSGLADTLIRVAMNVYGAPPLKGKEFAQYRATTKEETIVGLGLAVRLPTGEYMEDKLINLGQNRYVFRPQVGVTQQWGKWLAEATGQVAFYTDNDAFFNGNTLKQKPLFIGSAHLIYMFRPDWWGSFSLGYDKGGEKNINGVDKNDAQQNIAGKISVGYSINRVSSIKFHYIKTRTQVSTGLDSNSLAVSASYAW